MARALTTALLHRLRDAFPEGRAYGADDLDSPLLPSEVAHFLARALRHRAHAEAAAWLRARTSPWLDGEAEAVQDADDALGQALVASARYPAAAWPTALQQATTFVPAYLARPRRTLETFVFQQAGDALPADLVRRRLAYFAAYPYLRDAVEEYLAQRGDPALSRDRFRTVLARVDRHLTEHYDAAQWARLLRPLYDLAYVAYAEPGGQDDAPRAVPIAILRTFFGEKETLDAQQALEDAARRGTEWVTESDLRDLLGRPAAASPAPAPPDASVAVALAQPDLPDLAAAAPLDEPEPAEPPSGDLDSASLEAAEAALEPPPLSPEAPAAEAEAQAPIAPASYEPAPRDAVSEWIGPEDEPAATPPRDDPSSFAFQPDVDLFEIGDDEPGTARNDATADGDVHDDAPALPFGAQVPMLPVESTPRAEPNEEDQAEDSAAAQPRWQQFAGPRANPYAPNYSAHTGHSPGPASAPPPSTPAPRWQEFKQRRETPLGDLERLELNVLGPRGTANRALYTQYLFAGQPDAYQATLQRLAQAPDWPAASRIIGEEVFRRFQVNIYSDAAVTFTNQVEARFRAS